MNEQAFAKRALLRLAGQAVPYTLPEPTDADYLDWIEGERPGYKLAQPDVGQAEAEEYRLMLDDAREALETGLIDEARYQRMVSSDPTVRPSRELIERVNRWQPRQLGIASNGERVFYLTTPSGGPIWLTHERGRWVRHDGFPYSTL